MGLLGTILGQSDYKYHTTDVDKNAETGAPKYQNLENQLGAHTNQFTNQHATLANAAMGNAAQIDNSMGNAVNQNQNQLVGQLQAQANGTGPSLASGMLAQGTDRTLANQMGAAATLGASNPALAQRQLAMGAVTANQQLAQATAQQRMQDQINAQNQLGAVLGNQRGQDISQAMNQAQLNQQFGLANLSNQQQVNLANQGAINNVNQNNASNALGFDNTLGSTIGADAGNQQAYYNQQIAQDQWKQGQEAAQAQANAGAFGKLLSGVAGAAGSVMTGGLSSMAGPALSGMLGSGGGSGQNPNNPYYSAPQGYSGPTNVRH